MITFFVGLFVGFVVAVFACAYGNKEIYMDYYNKGREDAFREMRWDNMGK